MQAVHLKSIKNNFSQQFKDFAKITCDFPVYGIVKNLIIYFSKAFRYFSHYQFITVLPLSYPVFGAAYFWEHFPLVVSANTCLKVTLKNSNNFLRWSIDVENATSTRYKLVLSLVSSKNTSHHSHLKSIMHPFPKQLLSKWSCWKFGKLGNWGLINLWHLFFSSK